MKLATILSLDPGLRNYGYSVIRSNSRKTSVVVSGRIFTTVTQLTAGLVPQFKAHSDTIRQLIEEHQVTHLIVERYMSRRMGGITIEAVNLMIGGLLEICTEKGIFFRCIPSSQWKNASNRAKEGFLEGEYQLGKTVKVTNHTIDATMIGLFALGLMRKEEPYPTSKLKAGIIVRMIQKGKFVDIGTLIKPTKRKGKRGKR